MRNLKELQEEMDLFNKTRVPRCFTCKKQFKLIQKGGQAETWNPDCMCVENQQIRICLLDVSKNEKL